MIGSGFCILAVMFVSLHGFIWGDEIIHLFTSEIINKVGTIPIFISILGTTGIIGILLCLINLITKRIPIKV